MQPKKYNQLVNRTKKEQAHRYSQQAGGYQWGKGSREGEYTGEEINRYKLLSIK